MIMKMIYLGLLLAISIIVGVGVDDDIDCDSDDDCINVDAGWKYASGVSISDGDIVIIVKEIDSQLYSLLFSKDLEVLKSHC